MIIVRKSGSWLSSKAGVIMMNAAGKATTDYTVLSKQRNKKRLVCCSFHFMKVNRISWKFCMKNISDSHRIIFYTLKKKTLMKTETKNMFLSRIRRYHLAASWELIIKEHKHLEHTEVFNTFIIKSTPSSVLKFVFCQPLLSISQWTDHKPWLKTLKKSSVL